MESGLLRFDRFVLDRRDRRLLRDGVPVELNARYLDALALMAAEPNRLVTKDRFMDEVWRGIPVTDEALTQCIRSLRRLLGDDAARPRFIETVPKHGYRFIAPVETIWESAPPGPEPAAAAVRGSWRDALLVAAGGTLGAGIAGAIGGLFYGLVGTVQPQAGATSVLVVLLCLTIIVALVGGGGVSIGIAGAGALAGRPWRWAVAGGAIGGMLVGGAAELLGLDAFNLLLGQSPGDITGAGEGLVIGAAAGLGARLAARGGVARLRRGVALAALVGAAGGLLITLLGGRLMGGSLDQLGHNLPQSRLRLDRIGAMLGEDGFGTVSRIVTGMAEGALFCACVVAALILAERSIGLRGSPTGS